MKISKCSICGTDASAKHFDVKGKGTVYGVECACGHFVSQSFGTKNRAIHAWNECQEFMVRYMGARQ